MRKPAILLTLVFFSCSHEPKTIPAVPATPKEIYSPANDPYFVESRDIVSTHGPHSITRNILQDRNGNIWFATWEGIISYDASTSLFTNFTLKENLKRFHIFSVLEDRAGNLWFGSIGGGAYRYDGKSFALFTTTGGLADNSVTCMLEDKAENIWFGTGNGVSRFDGNTLTFTNFTKEEVLSYNSVNSIIQDRTGKLWFGTRGGVSCYDGKSFTRFTNGERSFHNVRSIVEDKSGNIWIGSEEGLCRYDPSASLRTSGKSFTYFTKNFTGYIFEDKTGNIWLSEGDGRGMVLSRYDGRSFVKITTQFFNQVFGITEDRDGNIWFGTETGACRYDPSASLRTGGKSFTDFNDDESKP